MGGGAASIACSRRATSASEDRGRSTAVRFAPEARRWRSVGVQCEAEAHHPCTRMMETGRESMVEVGVDVERV
jgi:hypothetical protein